MTGRPPASPYGVRAGVFVGLATLFCLLHARRWQGWRFALIFLALTLTCSLAAETAGSLTGAVFGAYAYGPDVPGRLGGLVPIVVPLAWYVVSYVSYAAAVALTDPGAGPVGRAVTAAFLFVGYDLVADPNHLHRGGWSYSGGGAYLGVPLQNFVAWLLLGLGTFLLLERWRRRGGLASPSAPASRVTRLGLLAYVGLLVHESAYALWIAGHPGSSAVGLGVATLVLSIWLWRARATQSPSAR